MRLFFAPERLHADGSLGGQRARHKATRRCWRASARRGRRRHPRAAAGSSLGGIPLRRRRRRRIQRLEGKAEAGVEAHIRPATSKVSSAKRAWRTAAWGQSRRQRELQNPCTREADPHEGGRRSRVRLSGDREPRREREGQRAAGPIPPHPAASTLHHRAVNCGSSLTSGTGGAEQAEQDDDDDE